jgi:GDPmannose 4,6-dehydratase
MAKVALITGITGQDGSYLAEFLLSKDYIVHGLIRRASTFNTSRLSHIYRDPHDPDARLFLHYGDLSDSSLLTNLIREVRPEELYHLGAQSHVGVSFVMPEYTGEVIALGTVRLLEAVHKSGVRCRFYQASSSEMFGDAPPPQNEETPFHPRSPYGAAKLHAYWLVRNYREGHQLFACNGIMFNHESPRRGEIFVSRKITRAVAAIVAGGQRKLYLGNLDARRDWGYAPEYVEAMWSMLQQEQPCDLVFGTGESHTVKDFVDAAFGAVNFDWRDYVELDARYRRPTEVDALEADAAKAKRRLGWEPRVGFKDLVSLMLEADLQAVGIASSGTDRFAAAQRRLPWLKRP